jgi:Putative adhesin
MPTFDTPEPISATIAVAVGDVRVSAGDRAATVVDVRPSDASNEEDVKAAELARVEYANGQLLVKAPKTRSWLSRSGGGSIDVTIELPAGSRLHGAGGSADFHCDGPLGDCRIKTGLGHIRLDRAATLSLKSGFGDITVDRATGDAEVAVGSGDVRVRELDGSAVIKNANGDTWIGVAARDVRLNAANGSIAVDLANAGVGAKSANGDVRLGEAVRGSVVLETQIGDVEVGIREGTAAWLDVSASAGKVHNALATADAPEPSARTVEVRARTSVGDVVIRRP